MNFFEKLFKPPQELPQEEEKVDSRESYLKTQKEEILESSEKEEKKDLGGGANETFFIKLRDDGSGVFKPKDGECTDLRKNIERGTYFKRERAAYLVNRFLNFNLVPPTVIKEIDGREGSFQEFIPDTNIYAELEIKDRIKFNQSTELIKLYIFDYIIFNSDRHNANLLIKDDKIYAIDNGLSFGDAHLQFGFKIPSKLVPPKIIDNLKNFFSSEKEKSILKDLLLELLSPKEVNACLARIEWLTHTLKQYRHIHIDQTLNPKNMVFNPIK